MFEQHLYLSLIPQALIASMLPPEDFGSYYAVGSKVHSHGEAMFFELDPAFRSNDFPFEMVAQRCVPGPNGEPKKSVYLAIYRVLSRIPVSALGKLYLVTSDGLTLELAQDTYVADSTRRLYLYQEFVPVIPMVGSRLEPLEFCRFITNPEQAVHVPRIVFSQLQLHALATDPAHGAADDLPYRNLDHLRDVLVELDGNPSKQSKLVMLQVKDGPYYRMIRDGLYVGDQTEFAFYRFPSTEKLESDHHAWWRSAQTAPLY